MRFEKKTDPGKGSWYEIDILPAPGDKNDYYLLVGWGPPELVLEEKREIFKGPWPDVDREFEKIRTRIEGVGFARLDEKETDDNK